MGVVAEIASRVIVMYAGEVVEEAPVQRLFASPQHPYTEGLLAAMPRLGSTNDRLVTIPGTVPAATAWPNGCRFQERCTYAWERSAEHPELTEAAPGHRARCHLVSEPQRRAQKHEPAAARK
jgi:oligopeptide/dipeptide ABC transporter ATP-binding protein